MAKATPDAVLDKMADYVIAQADTELACSGQPANHAGIAAVALADVTIASGDWTKADGNTSGRKATLAAKNGANVDASGTATHIVIDKVAATAELLYVTTCTSQSLTSGNTVNFPSWKFEVADPS